MKNILFLMLLPLLSFGQHTDFQFTKDTITDYVVLKSEGKTAADLYKKTLQWISVYYKSPKDVIKSQIENEYIRIEGSTDKLVVLKPMLAVYFESRYQIEFYFKDGRFKMDVIRVEAYTPANQFGPGKWFDMNISSPNEYYKENGELRGNYKLWPESFTKFFNNLAFQLLLFIESNNVDSKSDKW